jgi:hypothetical protein
MAAEKGGERMKSKDRGKKEYKKTSKPIKTRRQYARL